MTDVLHFSWQRRRAMLSAEERFRLLWQLPPVGELGVHRICVPLGPAIQQGSLVRPRNGILNITALCSKCGRAATNTSRWIELSRTRCSDAPFRGRRVRNFHAFSVGPPKGLECTACGMVVTSAARAAAERRHCPVWHYEVSGINDPAATAWGLSLIHI